MEEREILEPYELRYSDFRSLSSFNNSRPITSSRSEDEFRRLEAVTGAIMETLGPNGPGLLVITEVPNVSNLRKKLLLLARDLSLVNNDDRKRILKEHMLGSDVPLKNLDRCVSSFSMQLKYGHDLDTTALSGIHPDNDDDRSLTQEQLSIDGISVSMDNQFKNLGTMFMELGLRMTDLGLRLARICDRAIGGQDLEQSLLESCTAKGRLIHYHSALDTLRIQQLAQRKASTKRRVDCRFQLSGSTNGKCAIKSARLHQNGDTSEKGSDLWQQWHYDYGTFTVLTSPMFMTSNLDGDCKKYCGYECPSSSGHTYLRIFDPNKKNIRIIKAPPDSFIVQVGESADILSKGKLRATLHSVYRPIELENLSRETFVVFLHPAWNKIFDISDYPNEQLTSNHKVDGEEYRGANLELKKLTEEIHKIIPPLCLRLKHGMTFAEFSRETTKQYYSNDGLQPNRSREIHSNILGIQRDSVRNLILWHFLDKNTRAKGSKQEGKGKDRGETIG